MVDSHIATRTVEFAPHKRNVFFHVLTKCNLKCRHCYINPREQGEGILDASTISSWLMIFAGKAVEVQGERALTKFRPYHKKISTETNVIFLGGEPTINPALPEAIQCAKDLGFRSVTVDTNGYLFHDFLHKTSPDLLDNICFSLDGSTPAVNDPIRGSGSFDVCCKGIEAAISLGFSVSVIFTASSLNIHDLPNMPSLLTRLGVKRFFIQVVGIRGRPAQDGAHDLQVNHDLWQSTVPRVAHEAAGMGIVVTYPKVFLEVGEEFVCAGIHADNYFVFPNGRVYACPLCEDYPVHAYEISEGGLRLRPPITELDLFGLEIPEGCVMNKILHPGTIPYDDNLRPKAKVACCMVKCEVSPLQVS